MSFADFDAARRERQRALEPIRFRLGGTDFECMKLPTLTDAFDLAQAPEPRKFDGTPNLVAVAAIIRFIEALIIPRQRKKFRKALESRTEVIDAQSIIELGEWLVEQYSNRPTVRSISSSDGPQEPGPTSNTSRFAPADNSTS